MSAAPTPTAWPAWVDDLFQQAGAARKAGRYPLALAILRRIAEAAPDHAVALQHLGALLTVLGRRDQAEAALRRAVAADPRLAPARHALGMTLMAQGRYAEAWPHYEARFDVPQLGLKKPAGLPFPEWRGEDLAGKRLLIVGEMGFGDQIQHARFAARLRERAAAVILVCRPALTGLFADSLDGVQVIAAGEGVVLPDADYWAMSGSLMGLTGAAPETVPASPYLRTGAALPPLAPVLSEGFKVGLMTAGDPSHGNDANRSLPPAFAERLRAALPGQVIPLAPGHTNARDFAETAAIVAGLDLVVSVDTAVAHLTGALGRPGFVLIPAVNTDWRWMHKREDSPWYPSLRLYRADPAAGWAPALERLTRDAHALANRRG